MDIVEGLRVKDTPESPARRWHGLCQSGWSEVSKKTISTQMNSHPKKNVMKVYEKQMKYNEMNIYWWHI